MDKTRKKKGDDAEKFVAGILKERGYMVEIHPRTFRIIYIHGKPIQVSKDNDYYNLFDVKAEASDHMIYAQVKFENEKANVRKGNWITVDINSLNKPIHGIGRIEEVEK